MMRLKSVLILSVMLLISVIDCYATGYTDPAAGMEFIFVKGGCYQMGDIFGDGQADEKPVHQVCIDDFYIGKYAVTQAQYQQVMGKNPSVFKDCGPNCPVENVSWEDAQTFANRLAEKSGKKYRLPYESEWEYAARSGGKNEKWAGTSDPKQLKEYAWIKENSGNNTHPVGTRRPNGIGIYDMNGNVSQWCQDWYDEKYYEKSPQENPHGALSGSERVTRGGCWIFTAEDYKTSGRLYFPPDFQHYYVGFRLAFSAGR